MFYRVFLLFLAFIIGGASAFSAPVISEFMAKNEATLTDEDGDYSDWIEIHNPTAASINLEGWTLTDKAEQPGMWHFPSVTLQPGEYLLVFASNKNRRVPGQPLHTNFALSTGGEYLGLISVDGATVGTEFAPAFPPQLTDVSYGTSTQTPEFPAQVGYFLTVTPGAENPPASGMMLMESVAFSQSSRTFTDTLAVSLSGAGAGQQIRYTTDGSVPDGSSALYTAPFELQATTLLRARIFDSSGVGGLTGTGHFIRLSPALAARRSNLPMVVLDAHGQDLDGETRRSGYLQLFDRNPEGISSLNATPDLVTRQGMRHRGSSSELFPKKPYSVEFWDENDQGQNLPVLGMNAEEDWVFYGGYQYDRSFNRNTIAYELARRAGHWAPNSRFVEVFYNADGKDLDESDYVGVYAIVERIKMNARRMGESTVAQSAIPPVGPIDVNAEGPWTGGYVFKVDRDDPDEYLWRTPKEFPIVLYRPKMENLDGGPYTTRTGANGVGANSRQASYLRNYVAAFENALYADQANGFTTRNYLNYIDRDSWIDYLIISAFSKDPDAMALSTFFNKPQNQKIKAGPAWDFDRAMGAHGYSTAVDIWHMENYSRLFTFQWWGVLCQDPDFVQAFYDRWAQLRQTVYSDSELAALVTSTGDEIDNSAHGLGSAAARDAAKWPGNAPRGGNYQGEITLLRNWVLARAAWMDNRAISAALLPVPPVITEDGDELSFSSDSGTVYYTLDGSDPRAAGGAVAGTGYSGGGIPTVGATVIVARVRAEDGSWSTPIRIELEPRVVSAPVFLPIGNGSWNSDVNWDSAPAAYPNATSAVAIVPFPGGSSNRNVDLDEPVVVGRLTLPMEEATARNRIRSTQSNRSLTFASYETPSQLQVYGTGTGFVELEIVGGVVLANMLEVNVTNIYGDSEYGALRLREAWSGPGGLIKTGLGTVSLTGDDKLYFGETIIEEGVLRVTRSSAMVNGAWVTVLDGGQLRLISTGTYAEPAVYTFGGWINLNGMGRSEQVPEGSGMGKLGSLRYDPGSNGNHAIVVTNPVVVMSAADIHIDGGTNRMDLIGGFSGAAGFTKTGGGTLGLIGDNLVYNRRIDVANGTLLLRGAVSSFIMLGQSGVVDVAGETGPIDGSGTVVLPGTLLSTPSLGGVNIDMVFTRSGAPDASNPANSGNAVILTDSPGIPMSVDFYLDLPLSQTQNALVSAQGGYLLASALGWAAIRDQAPVRVFMASAEGSHAFRGKTWALRPDARVTPVAAEGGIGYLLAVEVDNRPLTYEDWRSAYFSAEELADEAISGGSASATGDGVSNLMRFALGVAPADPVASLAPRLSVREGVVAFDFPYRPEVQGVRWIVESSRDLVTWDQIVFDSQLSLMPERNGDWFRVETPVVESSRFFRLVLEEERD